jgi:hypothetical protein
MNAHPNSVKMRRALDAMRTRVIWPDTSEYDPTTYQLRPENGPMNITINIREIANGLLLDMNAGWGGQPPEFFPSMADLCEQLPLRVQAESHRLHQLGEDADMMVPSGDSASMRAEASAAVLRAFPEPGDTTLTYPDAEPERLPPDVETFDERNNIKGFVIGEGFATNAGSKP